MKIKTACVHKWNLAISAGILELGCPAKERNLAALLTDSIPPPADCSGQRFLQTGKDRKIHPDRNDITGDAHTASEKLPRQRETPTE